MVYKISSRTPGDEIRSVVRTMVRDVRYCVVFMSKAYITSPNCCVELAEAVSHPEKMWLCYLEEMPSEVVEYFNNLKPLKVCHGLEELIPLLHEALERTDDAGAYEWWCQQKIASSAIPSNITPGTSKSWEIIPKFSFWGDVRLGPKWISCGPVYISGDCKSTGYTTRIPWHFVGAFLALCFNVAIVVSELFFTTGTTNSLSIAWLIGICMGNTAPFLAWHALFDTRVWTHEALRPLLASKSIKNGVKIEICGTESDSMVIALKTFLKNIGHLYDPSTENYLPVIRVHILSTIEERNALFNEENFPSIDLSRTIFIWKDADNLPIEAPKLKPFSDDDIGHRMMSVLCLVDQWEIALSTSLFSAIGVRVNHALHPSESVLNKNFYRQ